MWRFGSAIERVCAVIAKILFTRWLALVLILIVQPYTTSRSHLTSYYERYKHGYKAVSWHPLAYN